MAGWRQYSWLEHGFGTRQLSSWPDPACAVVLKQTHSDIVVTARNEIGKLGEGDGIVTATAGSMLAIRTADCIPVLLVDPIHRAVGAVHAGWRGTAAGIARRAVDAMRREYDSEPREMEAAIGPGIGVCCYQVGPEVAIRFVELFGDGVLRGSRVDLKEANRIQLLSAGLDSSRISVMQACTMCDPEEFHSFRRDGDRAGRMVSAIGIVQPP